MGCGQAVSPEVDAGGRDAGADAGLPDAGPGPLEYLVVLQTSSLAQADFEGARVPALFSLLDAQPENTAVSFAVMAGPTLTSLSGFAPIGALTASDRANLSAALTPADAGAGALDLQRPLQALRLLLAAELARQPRARLRVLLITGGAPRDQDQALLCTDVVGGLPALGDVRLDIAYLFRLTLPACSGSVTTASCSVVPTPATCSSAVIGANRELFRQLAALGHGGFHFYGPGDALDLSLALAPE